MARKMCCAEGGASSLYAWINDYRIQRGQQLSFNYGLLALNYHVVLICTVCLLRP